MLRQTQIITERLRQLSKQVREKNLKINEWVDGYIDECILNGRPVEILTQYCLSKDLEKRYEIQGGRFELLNAELDIFYRAIPEVISIFKNNGASINWYLTFNNSFLDRGRLPQSLLRQYMQMIENIAQHTKDLILYNWEDDILGKRPEASMEVMSDFDNLVSKQAFQIDMKNLLDRVHQHNDSSKSQEELRQEAMFKIACEAEEGRYIFSSESPFSNGNILIVPLEFPERLVFFETLAPGFQNRIVPVLKLYPWRIDASNLKYIVPTDRRGDW